jgi:general nucleoside transport system ATP-binding protein
MLNILIEQTGIVLMDPVEPSKPASEPEAAVIKTVNLCKRFSTVIANDQISLEVRQGEIHCLLGENGAGKTTLAECLYGYYSPDSGQILYKGSPVTFSSPRDAIALGIGMVHQRFVLIRAFTVLENIILSANPPDVLLDVDKIEQEIKSLCNLYHMDLNLHSEVWRLSVGEQQWIEILKAIYSKAQLLILDEPTSVLTPGETEVLFDFLRKMKESGLSILLITHKLEEVMMLADRVTVLRKGKLVNTVTTSTVTKEDLAKMMVGRDFIFSNRYEKIPPGAPILELEDLCARNSRGQDGLKGISFTLHHNEILGVAGVSGNGQKELFEVLIGAQHAASGRIKFEGREITALSTNKLMQLGIAHVPEDRIQEGLIMEFSVAENLILGQQRNRPYSKGFLLDQQQIMDSANRQIPAYEIVTPGPNQKTKFLSGGNLQKVILARELDRKPGCLLVNQPTCGLDIGVVEYVHKQLIKLRDEGTGILLISEDLEELFALSDRILVMFKGQIMGDFPIEEAQLDTIGLLMAGVKNEGNCLPA